MSSPDFLLKFALERISMIYEFVLFQPNCYKSDNFVDIEATNSIKCLPRAL